MLPCPQYIERHWGPDAVFQDWMVSLDEYDGWLQNLANLSAEATVSFTARVAAAEKFAQNLAWRWQRMTTDLENNEENEGNEHGRPKITAEDGEMLSLVINDALEGVDITRRYPAFYRRLLADPHLRQIFLEAMKLLEKDEAIELDPLPEPASIDLSFLAQEEKAAAGTTTPLKQLRITLTRTRQQLRDLFAPPPTAVPMRSALTGMEDEYVTLLRNDVPTEHGELEVILEGRRPAAADALHPVVLVILPEEVTPQQSMRATLQWGSYRETESLDQRGRASFPPLALDAILDEEGDLLAGLKLELVA